MSHQPFKPEQFKASFNPAMPQNLRSPEGEMNPLTDERAAQGAAAADAALMASMERNR